MTEYAQFCALARAAEILGERWTLLILRELYLGPKRFSDLSARLKPVAPGILNGRLRSLERHGVIARRNVGPPTPARLYELTESGRALEPALFELLRWGARYLFPQRPGERFETEWLVMVLRAYLRGGPHRTT
ncbi:MAG: helix-turn-helix transcriptional regulator [Dehalococcoidia bacterium]|nr:helix-turn-helix transcriptional regulator [Dehalococcoidia bacterium]